MYEDMHVHSTFSDGRDDLSVNVSVAERRRLRRMCCVDHVRRDTLWIPDFVSRVRKLDATSPVQLFVGIEAKILDSRGTLDLPAKGLSGVDHIYIADHQVPFSHGVRTPKEVRHDLRTGRISRSTVVATVLVATARALQRHPGSVIAHLFSVLPKVGLSEDDVPESWLAMLADVAAETGAHLEVDERWLCPSPRVIARFAARGIPIWASTDSHQSDTIGRYQYVTRAIDEAADMIGAQHAS